MMNKERELLQECLHLMLDEKLQNHQLFGQIEELLTQSERQQHILLDEYDTGLLSDFGGGDTAWWWDYMRNELGSAHDHYQSQVNQLLAQPETKQEPAALSDLQIWTANSDPFFEDGVRFAEAHYGITRGTK